MAIDAQQSELLQQHPLNNQTQLLYGTDVQNSIASLIKKNGAQNVLVLCAIEEWKSLFWYQQIIESFHRENLSIHELHWNVPCAEMEEIERVISFCKKEKIDYILAVGGGNVIDSAKAIAMGIHCKTDLWSYITSDIPMEQAVPLSVVLTIPGSGSENNGTTIITNSDTLLKKSYSSPFLQPEYCFANPQIFYTISDETLSSMIGLMLQRMVSAYFLSIQQNNINISTMLENQIKQFLKNGLALQKNRLNNRAWKEVVLQSFYTMFLKEDACREMAAGLSLMYHVSYGAVTSVLLPAWIRYISEKNQTIVLAFGRNIFEISEFLSEEEQIMQAVVEIETYFSKLSLPQTLCALGIQAFCLENVAQLCTNYGWGQEQPIGTLQPLYWQDIVQIYQSVYYKQQSENKMDI